MSYTNGLDKPTDYFNTNLYVGNGTDAHAITGVGFQPDFVWLKNRDGANAHQAFDSVRGATETLFVNETSAEATYSNTLQSFDTDGFTVGTSSGANLNANNFVSWNWLASNTTASNTDGSITSTVSANTTSGFSIVSYTGTGANATVGHGLGSAPTMIIVKNINSTNDWNIGHPAMGWDKRLFFNSNAESSGASWNSTAPTSSVFSIGTASATNTSGNSHIAYCFAEKKGFSKFGSYTGNGNADGTFVYTGFKPAWVMAKKSNSTGNWVIVDTKRDGYNGANDTLQANVTDVESGGNRFDIVSNGFKARSTSGYSNTSGDTFIYMCFASEPFTTSTGIPTTAR